jgi:membrane-bound metal-dependent hydrolase YbcI (DUF457 family)
MEFLIIAILAIVLFRVLGLHKVWPFNGLKFKPWFPNMGSYKPKNFVELAVLIGLIFIMIVTIVGMINWTIYS